MILVLNSLLALSYCSTAMRNIPFALILLYYAYQFEPNFINFILIISDIILVLSKIILVLLNIIVIQL